MAYRSLSASFGAMTVPVVFKTLQNSGYSLSACIIGASLILLDNAHVAETRLILLDATLILSIALSFYCYVGFSNQRRSPFSRKWWAWLCATGISLSCVISTKYVGVFTFLTIGTAVLIDLWELLDYNKGLTMVEFGKHFFARALGLIILPLCLFLFWFWVHFAILNKSGPGDNFMSPEFQETLGDNPMAKEARQINYYDIVTLKHRDTGVFLHSHEARYPLRYDDGRISSEGQQVTGYSHEDINNEWQILPPVDYPEELILGNPVFGGNHCRLRHVATNTMLLTHDVASPSKPTNQEFTTVSMDDAAGTRHNETIFELRMNSGSRDGLKTKSGLFKLIHVPTFVAMWTYDTPLPDWGFGQFEINGNKQVSDGSNTWYFDEITDLTDPDRLAYIPKEPKKLPFLKKYLELQLSMFAQNNALTSSHPYASEPITWPFLIRGVSFWTNDDDKTQIYFVGNFAGWWLEVAMIAVFLGVVAADQLTRRRNIEAINSVARSKIYHSMAFFFTGWVTHYFPFFLMGRQLFLHHYLPAHLAAALLCGGAYDFIFGEFDDDVVEEKRRNPGKRRINMKLIVATVVTFAILTVCFMYLVPLTYGYPGLTPEEVKARQWMKIELHFSK